MSSGWLLAHGLALVLAGTDALPVQQAAASSVVSQRSVRAAVGALEVVTRQPGLPVLVDGDLRGRTPVRVDGLSPGLHRVQVGRQGADMVIQEVLIQQGTTVKLEPALASVVTAPVTAPVRTGLDALPGKATLLSMATQPWAYASAALCGVSLLGAGILWTSTPQKMPVLGRPPVELNNLQFQALRWGALGLVATSAAATVVLFILPALPILRDSADQGGAANSNR
ncbi:MAG: PEGA domain-containing protein [Myxococcota bacterium]